MHTKSQKDDDERRRNERERAALALRPRRLGARLRPQRGAAAVPIRHPQQQYVPRILFIYSLDIYQCALICYSTTPVNSVQGRQVGGESDDDDHDPARARRPRWCGVPLLLDPSINHHARHTGRRTRKNQVTQTALRQTASLAI